MLYVKLYHVLVAAGFCKSTSEARRLIRDGAVRIYSDKPEIKGIKIEKEWNFPIYIDENI